ncbi:hypothetical protein tb265_48050 [Gemmatimonadetes bacterium T265]|nr:hypothetical protein tb265_48050 [Gemmatimonadetes bacterium T265]
MRVLARGRTFDRRVGRALDDVRHHAADNGTVLGRLLDALETVGGAAHDPVRSRVLAEYGERVAEAAARAVAAPDDRAALAGRAGRPNRV